MKSSFFHIAAAASFALAILAAAIGVRTTVQLIHLYGNSASPLALTAQAAVLWVPPAAALTLCGWWLRGIARRRQKKQREGTDLMHERRS